MKGWRKVTVIIAALVLVAGLVSCDLFSSDGSGKDNGGTKVNKPEFSVALSNYNDLTARRSVADGKIVLSLYGVKNYNTGSVKTFTAGQKLNITRIENDSKIYMEGELRSTDLNEDMRDILGAIKLTIGNALSGAEGAAVENILGYLNGTNSMRFNLGYDGIGSYNAKGNIINGAGSNEIYVATNDDFINYELTKKLIGVDFQISDYLMFSTFVNFNGAAGWISGDGASAYLDNAKNQYNYILSANNEKIYNYIFGLISQYAEGLDLERYAADAQKYNECIGFIKKWVSIGDSTVSAAVNKDNLPLSMSTSIRVNVNIKVSELRTVIHILIDDEAKANKIWNPALEVLLDAVFRGINDERGYIGASLDISLNEEFSYDAESVSLEGMDPDLFISASDEKAGRVSYLAVKPEDDQED